jgi:hypothetical protein
MEQHRDPYLMRLVGGPGPGPRRGARFSSLSGTLPRPFGILPYQVSPYPRNILKSVTWGQAEGQGKDQAHLSLTPFPTYNELGQGPISTHFS